MAVLSNHIHIIRLIYFWYNSQLKETLPKPRVHILFPSPKMSLQNFSKAVQTWKKNWVKILVFATFTITLGQNNLKYCLAIDWCIMFHSERHIYKSNPTWLISISKYSSSPFLLTLNRDHIYNYGEVYK